MKQYIAHCIYESHMELKCITGHNAPDALRRVFRKDKGLLKIGARDVEKIENGTEWVYYTAVKTDNGEWVFTRDVVMQQLRRSTD